MQAGDPISPELVLIDPLISDGAAAVRSHMIDPLDPRQPAQPELSVADAATRPAVETLLFGAGLITADQLGELVRDAVLSQRTVGAVALERGLVTAEVLQSLLAPSGNGAIDQVVAEPAVVVPAPEPEPQRPPDPPEPAVVAETPAPVAPVEETIAPVIPIAPPVAPTEPPEPPAEPAAVHADPPTPQAGPVEPLPVEVVAAPATVEPPLAPTASAEPQKFTLLLHLQNGERVPVDHAETLEAATERARTVSEHFATTAQWPLVGGRCIRPEAVISVDIERDLQP